MNGFTLLLLVGCFLFSRVALKWKRKADAWDKHVGKKHDKNWVPNYSELMENKKFEQYKRRVDYVFISLCSCYDWAIRRLMRIKIFGGN